MSEPSDGRTVYLKVQGIVRGLDYTREGETWREAAERLYNRFITPAEAERFIMQAWPLPFSSFGGQERWRVRMAWRPSPGGPAVPDPDIEVITQPRRTRTIASRPVNQHRRYPAC